MIDKKHFKLLIIFLLFIASCSDNVIQSFSVSDKLLEAEILREISSNHIQVEKDEFGNIWYAKSDEKIVSDIKNKLLTRYANAYKIFEPSLKEEFELVLSENQIYFEVNTLDNQAYHFHVKDDDRETVDILFDALSSKYITN